MLHGGACNDRLYGGRGTDELDMDAGADVLRGGRGDEDVVFLRRATIIDLQRGIARDGERDTIRGVETVWGSDGGDRMYGSSGRDGLVGNGGRDVLIGRAGSDSLVSGTGKGRLVGGRGNDGFIDADSFRTSGMTMQRWAGGRGHDLIWLLADDGPAAVDLVAGVGVLRRCTSTSAASRP